MTTTETLSLKIKDENIKEQIKFKIIEILDLSGADDIRGDTRFVSLMASGNDYEIFIERKRTVENE